MGPLFYLAVPGTVIVMICYLVLLGRIGVARAAYVAVLSPLIALGFATIFEGFVWAGCIWIGVALISAGNLLMQYRRL